MRQDRRLPKPKVDAEIKSPRKVAVSIAKRQMTLECPFCNWIYEGKKPDISHPVFSIGKPKDSDVVSDVIEEKWVCRNPRCKREFSVYWFDSKMYLDRT